MVELELLHESMVTPSEIDSLGHLNVRFYIQRVAEANKALVSQLGLDLAPGQTMRRIDTYNRFHREQFEGARLQTSGGLIASDSADAGNSFSSYFEIRNADTDVVAATFIVRSLIVDADDQPADLPRLQSLLQTASQVTVPEYGAPRSLSLKTPRAVSLEELEQVIGDDPTPGMMSGRYENAVRAEDCQANGRLRDDVDLMAVLHRLDPVADQIKNMGPPIALDSLGRRYSWAMLETRSIVFDRPMAGDQILSIGADVAHSEKWRQSRRWMFVKDTGKLIGISDSVGICIDLDARRAIAIPDEMRTTIAQASLPQFA